jgi:hypothetical protein
MNLAAVENISSQSILCAGQQQIQTLASPTNLGQIDKSNPDRLYWCVTFQQAIVLQLDLLVCVIPSISRWRHTEMSLVQFFFLFSVQYSVAVGGCCFLSYHVAGRRGERTVVGTPKGNCQS